MQRNSEITLFYLKAKGEINTGVCKKPHGEIAVLFTIDMGGPFSYMKLCERNSEASMYTIFDAALKSSNNGQ